ncbi:MAG TPA: hypothetical protein VGH87_02425, partial [Polyangiaceae bacterium]
MRRFFFALLLAGCDKPAAVPHDSAPVADSGSDSASDSGSDSASEAATAQIDPDGDDDPEDPGTGVRPTSGKFTRVG